MAQMSIRSTYALDVKTATEIKRLSAAWGVSQAEVIRRSVRRAADDQAPTLSPADVVAQYLSGPELRSAAQTKRLIAQWRQLRHQDDQRRMPGWHTNIHAVYDHGSNSTG
jgi:hypothetical protein